MLVLPCVGYFFKKRTDICWFYILVYIHLIGKYQEFKEPKDAWTKDAVPNARGDIDEHELKLQHLGITTLK